MTREEDFTRAPWLWPSTAGKAMGGAVAVLPEEEEATKKCRESPIDSSTTKQTAARPTPYIHGFTM
jgi:hypothetical protein